MNAENSPAWFSLASCETDGDQELRLAEADASMLKKDMMLAVQKQRTKQSIFVLCAT